MVAHNYSNTASVAVLADSLNASVTSFAVTNFTGYPSAPFWILVDRDTSQSELMEVTAVVSSTLTVVRGQGGTAATSHSVGGTVEHVIPAAVPQSLEQHVEATGNVHGVTGNLVGLNTTGTLTNKTYQGAHTHVYSNATPASPTAGFYVEADTSAARDGFVAENDAADSNRRGFLLSQAGVPRIEQFYDGTLKVTPNGSATRPGIESTTSIKAATAEVTGAATVGGTLGVTGALNAAGAINADGAGTGLAVDNNATVGGDLSVGDDLTVTGDLTVAGPSSVAALTSSGGLSTTGTAGISTAGGNVTIGGNGKLALPASPSGSGTAAGQVRYRTGNVEAWNGTKWVGNTAYPQISYSPSFTGVNSTTPRTIATFSIPDPGHPYFLIASGAVELNVADPSTRWDLNFFEGSNLVGVGVGNGFTVMPMVASPVYTGAKTVTFRAARVLGSGSVDITPFNPSFTVVQIAASYSGV